ncbi:MAG: hypothetical protein JSW73_03865 [Candidatus Woesearchaeota archaeon]|nr:MAG: hypothetical protein JSW73_03865 [Candidatus Woesearchaeota archaeon]
MTNPVPKWIMLSYSSLWNHFQDREFDHESSAKIIDNKQMVSIILSKLRKAGWLEVKLDPEDSRKRIYKLKSPTKIIEEMQNE